MKILYHHRTLGDGAEGIHINEIVQAFGRLGHQVKVTCPRAARRAPGLATSKPTKRQKHKSGLKPFIKQSTECVYNIVSFLRVFLAIHFFKPNFIYERYSAYNAGGIFAAKIKKIPVILEVNRTYAGKYPADFKSYYPRTLRLIEAYCLKNAKNIIVVSDALRKDIIELIEKGDAVHVVPNGINEDSVNNFDYQENRSRVRRQYRIEDTVVVGFVGSLRIWHGIDMLAESIPALASRIPNLHFLIVGDGECFPLLESLREQPELNNRITLTGSVPHKEVNQWIAAMDIGLMPDSNPFDSPMKMLEYMSMSTVPIGPNLPTITTVISDNETGLVFQRRNSESFERAIERCASDHSLRQRLSGNAKKHVLQNHTWTQNAKLATELLAEQN